MATETQTAPTAEWAPLKIKSQPAGGLPRLKTSDVNVPTLLGVNNDMSALSCSSAVSQIIGGYMYTPLTPKPPQFKEGEEGKLEQVQHREEEESEEGSDEDDQDTPVEDMFKKLERVLSSTSMEVPFGLLLEDMPTPTEIQTPAPFLKRQSGVRRNSKFSSRLSQLQAVNTGNMTVPRTFIAEDSPIDWPPIQRLMPRDPKQPVSAISPMSCITDAFTEETRWSSLRGEQDEVFENHAVDDEREVDDRDWQSCTDTTTVLSPCETAPTWDGVTIIDDVTQVSEPTIEEFSHQDFGKEVVTSELKNPVVSCRIDSVVDIGFPEFLPVEEGPEPEPPKLSRRGAIEAAPPPPLVPQRAATDPLSISRQVMRQEWTETPPMKIDMAKLESIVPPRIPTPNNGRASPKPWLVPRSASPARSLEKRGNSPEPIKRARSPRGWKFW
ncbi:hypothetical protein FN846DRAFT_531820 [Sphaerosporella brunnea]|uniref:Uncharacterized protein n=1 Tax=Sphaerosporella brunnea TaxID=1250544 RepID=A0A5J5F2P9_9PEZI|nr:hypothetical protein FN846DRAFT_531820 [Sphaerosporella brunnea]